MQFHYLDHCADGDAYSVCPVLFGDNRPRKVKTIRCALVADGYVFSRRSAAPTNPPGKYSNVTEHWALA